MTSVVCAKEDAAYDHASGTDRCLTYLRKSESCKTIPPAFESREPDRALELFKSHHKRMLGDLIHKEPELMDEYELDLIVGTLPFGSRLLERTYGELRRRQRALCSKQNQPRSKKSSRSEDKAEQAKIRGPRNHRGLVEDVGLPRQSLAPNGSKSNAIKYDALMRRKIKLEVAKSAVHGQGCYTMESIASNQFIVEYIGEIIPQKVADLREIEYAKRNIECSYLFTLDNGQVVDATTGGNHSRFINHSCAPNCATRIIKIEGTPKIVFFALKHIAACKLKKIP
jgi:hypothetical protein